MMQTPHCLLAQIILGSLLLTGCKTLPVASHAIACDVSPALLEGRCAAPTPIANDSTYLTLVDTMQADRKALQECGIVAESLREALQHCKQATDAYNQQIDALNRVK